MSTTKSVKAFAPATIGNVVCGFDVLGLAIDLPGDIVEACLTDGSGISFEAVKGNTNISREIEYNTAGVAAKALYNSLNETRGVAITLHKNMPLGSGLGSSGASAVAAVVAVNRLLGDPLPKADLLPFAMEGEKLATGAAHADNVAPCLLGGLVLVRSYEPLEIVPINVPENLVAVVVHPKVELLTKEGRAILPPAISLKEAIKQWGNVAGLIAGFEQGDYSLIGRSMVDVVAEPCRAPMIPHFEEVKKAAIEAGALGCGISGSGPSVFSLCEGMEAAQNVAAAMVEAFDEIESTAYVSGINLDGAKIVG